MAGLSCLRLRLRFRWETLGDAKVAMAMASEVYVGMGIACAQTIESYRLA